jgi:hypothetical protein
MGNVALNKSVITNYNTIPPFTGDRALTADLSPLQRWVGVAAEGAYFTIDLGAAYFLNSFTAKSMTEATGANVQWTRPGYCNYGYQLSYSNNNASWVTLPTFSSNYASPYTGTITVSTIPYRYVKVAVGGTQINPQVASIVNLTLNEVPCLANLTISQGTLTPSFSPSVMAYTAAVDSTVSSINVVPTTPNSSYIWRVNGTTSQAVNLNYGVNTITVTCTSPIDGVTYTYNVVVTRQSSPNLTSLVLNDGQNNMQLTPTFDGTQTSTYSAFAGFDTTSISVTPTAANASATLTVNGAPATSGVATAVSFPAGTQTTTITVVSTIGGQSLTFTTNVTRSSSPYLASISGMPANLTPAFVKTTYSYTGSTSGNLMFKPVSEDTGTATAITIKYGTTTKQVASGTAVPITLAAGHNIITVTVTSTTGTDFRTYTFDITH